MKIALINENSQASKNTIIYKELKNVANIHGDTVYNYGMESAEENNLTYVQAGLLAAILINSKATDFVVTGCGTGEGACLALNKKILDEVKKITHKDMLTILKEIDREFLLQTINREQFKKYFFENAEEGEIKEFIKEIMK